MVKRRNKKKWEDKKKREQNVKIPDVWFFTKKK